MKCQVSVNWSCGEMLFHIPAYTCMMRAPRRLALDAFKVLFAWSSMVSGFVFTSIPASTEAKNVV